MPAPARSRRPVALLASSCLAVAGLIAGCDSETGVADKAVAENLRTSEAKQGGDAVADLQKASQEQNASPGIRAHAKALLGQAKVEQARKSLGEIRLNDIAMSRLVSEINELGIHVQTNNTIIAGYRGLAPKATEAVGKLLESEKAQVAGKGPQDVWKLGQAGQLPALTNAKDQVAKLEPQVKDLEAKKDELLKQREESEIKAGDSLRQSKLKIGKESVALFTKSVEESKKSADLATQIGALDHQLLKLTQELALVQGQSQQLEAAVKGIGEHIGQNQKSQAQIEDLIKQHQALSQKLVDGAAGPEEAAAPTTARTGAPLTMITNSTIAAKAKELAAMVAENDAKRKAAVELFTAAIGHFDGALADLQKARTDLEKNIRDSSLNQFPQAVAWKAAVAAYAPASVNIQKANTQQMIGALHRDALASLAQRRQMVAAIGPVLQEASMTLPSELADTTLDAKFQETQKAAAESYDAADTILQETVDGPGIDDPTRNAAQTAQVIALYGRAQLALVAGDKAASEQAMSKAKQAVSNGTMPAEQFPEYVRRSLGIAIEAPSTQPAPTSQPVEGTPAPAEGAAPTPAPEGVPATAPAEGAPASTAPSTAPVAQ